MIGCGGVSAHGLPITGINKVNVSCVTCFQNKIYKIEKIKLFISELAC